ncbi:MAG: IS3 family transposase [Bacillota bacterium]
MCKVSRSGYYEWLRRPAKVKVDVLPQKVKRVFMESRKTYGTRRIKKKLAAEEIVWSRKRIRRIMAEQGLVAKARCKTRAATDSNHNHPVAPNLQGGRFDADYPNQVWVTDITYLLGLTRSKSERKEKKYVVIFGMGTDSVRLEAVIPGIVAQEYCLLTSSDYVL